MLQDTLQILEKGYYRKGLKKIKLKLSPKEMRESKVYLPDDIAVIAKNTGFQHPIVSGRCGFACENRDAFALARARDEYRDLLFIDKSKPILVLNLANPVNPGGGVRKGARAQEEDLCRKSSLLLALEDQQAAAYYAYNKSLHSYMGSDGIIITPKVEIIKDEKGELLDESVIVAVMTCAAPMIKRGLEGLSQKEYEELLYHRITSMLTLAAYLGYEGLVLGAFGCGAFGNDAKLVSDIFFKAFKNFCYNDRRERDFFRRVDFAVLSRDERQYNYKEFCRNFDDYYREEDAAVARSVEEEKRGNAGKLNKIKGCLMGGAAGDALGYAVEFDSEASIFSTYGSQGITEYQMDPVSGKALISDDTQMTLFTGNGILVGETRACLRGIGGIPHVYVEDSYLDWLATQEKTFAQAVDGQKEGYFSRTSWLLDVPELYSRRAPGGTCLSALAQLRKKPNYGGFVANPCNNSKGCGAVMRIAPLGIHYENLPVKVLAEEAAELSAITHGHPLGYMPSAVLTLLLHKIVFGDGTKSLENMVMGALDETCQVFKETDYVEELRRITTLAVELSHNDDKDLENIHRLGEGWVAEEALAIAIYCALRYKDDFSKGIIAAVNHKGDSDSTGAIAGNILGAYLGYERIEDKWKENLELSDVILEMAEDLCYGCKMVQYSPYRDEAWVAKYIEMRRYDGASING